MAKDQQGLTQVEYARTRGISTRYVRALTRKGVMVLMPNGKINAEASDLMREKCIAPRINRGDWNRPIDIGELERRLDNWLTRG